MFLTELLLELHLSPNSVVSQSGAPWSCCWFVSPTWGHFFRISIFLKKNQGQVSKITVGVTVRGCLCRNVHYSKLLLLLAVPSHNDSVREIKMQTFKIGFQGKIFFSCMYPVETVMSQPHSYMLITSGMLWVLWLWHQLNQNLASYTEKAAIVPYIY